MESFNEIAPSNRTDDASVLSPKRFVDFLRTNIWAMQGKPFSRFAIASDSAGWVLDEEAKEIINIARDLHIESQIVVHPFHWIRQCVHYTSQFSLLRPQVFSGEQKISFDYFHGKPHQEKDFASIFEAVKKNHQKIAKIRLSHSGMLETALNTGIDPQKIIRIAIGINPNYFSFQTTTNKSKMRDQLGIPKSAIVIGSFQKDGSGWGEGMEPKPVKGPDIFLEVIKILRARIPELMILLTGPARGYVKSGLEKIGVPYRHYFLKEYRDIGQFYQALDAYIITSREEGGPKAILESMISGIPLITTAVGQAIDLVKHGENAYMTELEDAEALANFTEKYISDTAKRAVMTQQAYETALTQTYAAQKPLWKNFFAGYVDSPL